MNNRYNNSESPYSPHRLAEMRAAIDNLEAHQNNPQGVKNMGTVPANLWDRVDVEVSNLSETEQHMLRTETQYGENELYLQAAVQNALIAAIKPTLLKDKKVNELLQANLDITRTFTKQIRERKYKEDQLFKDYITNHSDITWGEYIAKVKGKQPAPSNNESK